MKIKTKQLSVVLASCLTLIGCQNSSTTDNVEWERKECTYSASFKFYEKLETVGEDGVPAFILAKEADQPPVLLQIPYYDGLQEGETYYVDFIGTLDVPDLEPELLFSYVFPQLEVSGISWIESSGNENPQEPEPLVCK